MSRLGNMLRSFNNSNALVASGSQATDSVRGEPSVCPAHFGSIRPETQSFIRYRTGYGTSDMRQTCHRATDYCCRC